MIELLTKVNKGPHGDRRGNSARIGLNLRWIVRLDPGLPTRTCANTSANLAEYELRGAARKAHRMFTRKKFRKPTENNLTYHPPKMRLSYQRACNDCSRPCVGNVCQECFQKRVRAKHEAKVRAEDERVSANERAFKTVAKREAIMAKAKKEVTPILRSTSGLRETIFQEMEALRSGESNWQRARSMAMLANTVLDSVKTEVEYHKYVAAAPKIVESADNVKRLGTDISLVERQAA